MTRAPPCSAAGNAPARAPPACPSARPQASVFCALTSGLNAMCEAMWPGLASEGLLFFRDLTSPPVFLQV